MPVRRKVGRPKGSFGPKKSTAENRETVRRRPGRPPKVSKTHVWLADNVGSC
jgi:hypothetical protein